MKSWVLLLLATIPYIVAFQPQSDDFFDQFELDINTVLKAEGSENVARTGRLIRSATESASDSTTTQQDASTIPPAPIAKIPEIEDSKKQDATLGVAEKEILSILCDESQAATNSSDSSRARVACEILNKIQSSKEKSKPVLSVEEKYLPKDYSKYEIPRLNLNITLANGTILRIDRPAECLVFLNVRGVRDIDEENEGVTLDMDVILAWHDGNILKKVRSITDLTHQVHTKVVLTPQFLKKIWVPDIYFEEVISISQPTFLGNSVTVTLYPTTGLILYRSRILAKLSCSLDFKFYPADSQECKFTVKSFSYTTTDLTLNWFKQKGGGVFLHETSDPNFDYHITSTDNFNASISLGHETAESIQYTNLQFVLKIRRRMTYHLVQTYFASVFFVIVTWLCFLIPPDMFEVRVGIAMSTLLTLTAMFSSVREQTPIVSYVKAIDIWIVASILFIFAALAGFTITAWIKRGLKRICAINEDDEVTLELLDRKEKRVLTEAEREKRLRFYRFVMLVIEKFAIYSLSLTYIFFNIVYWAWLFSQSGYFDWDVDPLYNNVE